MEEGKELGLRTEGEWYDIKNVTAKLAYRILEQTRWKLRKEDDKVNQAMTEMKKELSPQEREFW